MTYHVSCCIWHDIPHKLRNFSFEPYTIIIRIIWFATSYARRFFIRIRVRVIWKSTWKPPPQDLKTSQCDLRVVSKMKTRFPPNGTSFYRSFHPSFHRSILPKSPRPNVHTNASIVTWHRSATAIKMANITTRSNSPVLKKNPAQRGLLKPTSSGNRRPAYF